MRVALASLLALGCASTVHVDTAGCDVDGEINTGTTIECKDDGSVVIERKSVSETTSGILGAALRAVIGGVP
jgi:hypothetical protein